MTNLFNKFKDFVGLSESDEEPDDGYETDYPNNKWQQYQNSDEEEEVEPAKPEPTPYRRPRDTMNFTTEPSLGTNRSNVIGMPGINGNAEVVVIEAHSFEEMPQIIQTLKKGKSVVLNLNVMDPDEAQRAVDFVAGGTFAIDGHQQRIGESIFLFTPSCVKVSTLEGVLNDAAETSKANVRTTSSWGADVNRIAQ